VIDEPVCWCGKPMRGHGRDDHRAERMEERTVFQCAARGCDGCTVCQPEVDEGVCHCGTDMKNHPFDNHQPVRMEPNDG